MAKIEIYKSRHQAQVLVTCILMHSDMKDEGSISQEREGDG